MGFGSAIGKRLFFVAEENGEGGSGRGGAR